MAAAVEIARRHTVRMAVIRRWSERENQHEKLQEFLAAIRARRARLRSV
jgi:hypothetical protein